MGLSKVRVDDSPFVGGIESPKARPSGITIDPTTVVRELAAVCPGIHADWGGRLNIWHPNQRSKQGLFYYHRHITAMDRGPMRQWPEWKVSEELVEIPIGEALLHDDLPIVALNDEGNDEITTQETAYVWRMKPEQIQHVGWAHVFWRVLGANLPGITREWIERTFRVNLAWMDSLKRSPVAESYAQVEQRTAGERVVNLL